MSLSNTTENTVLKCILAGIDMPFRSGPTQYIALFTADPGETGSLATEATYTGYARVAVTKATAWTDGGSTFTNAALVQFGACTAETPNALSFFAIVDTASGAVSMMIIGGLGSILNVNQGIQPQFPAGTLSISVD